MRDGEVARWLKERNALPEALSLTPCDTGARL